MGHHLAFAADTKSLGRDVFKTILSDLRILVGGGVIQQALSRCGARKKLW